MAMVIIIQRLFWTHNILYCVSFNRASSLFTGCNSFRVPILEGHAYSVKHLKCEGAKDASTSEKPSALLEGLQKMESNLREGMVNLFRIAYYIIKGEHSFTDFPKLNRSGLTQNLEPSRECRTFPFSWTHYDSFSWNDCTKLRISMLRGKC